MKLQDIRRILAELEFKLEEFQKTYNHINNQMIRMQVQAEDLGRSVNQVIDWAGTDQFEPSAPRPNVSHLSTKDH